MKNIFIYLLGISLLLVSCEKDIEVIKSSLTVSNERVTPSHTSAEIAVDFAPVQITDFINSGTNFDQVFVQYATSKDFAEYQEEEMQHSGWWRASLTNLQPNTTYYVRYFVKNKYSSAISNEVSEFKTLALLLPSITTSAVTQIMDTSAIAGGNVTADGGASVTERGVVYSTSPNPTISNSKVTSGSGMGSFTCNITNLQEGTTYYVRAYATNEKGTAYGNQVVFTTLEAPTENGHEYVDLGLSVKWATCNVGANKPEDYGDYFAWGETEPKSTYTLSTYKYYNGSSSTLTKYNSTVDDKTTLDLSDDAARANWGGSWRMPTKAEQDELRNNCTWTWTTQNGVDGHKVTSKSNGKSIFLPAAGYRDVSSLNNALINGNYWSSSFDSGYPDVAYILTFGSGYVDCRSPLRHYGFSVRPVYGEYIPASTLPTVTTSSATNISKTSATVGGNVTSDGGASVTERGVVYSTVSNPVINNIYHTTKVVGSGTGSFSVNLTNLIEGTTYYVRAYATNEQGTAYGNQVIFTTLEAPIENGHEYVDLGLSVKWATCNVGASTPEDYGDYFAWGETEPKSSYSWIAYKYGSSSSLTKYCTNSSYGTVDNKTTLELSDDAARANWGGSWRMPTKAEQDELRNNCTWTWTTQNGVNGYKVTSKSNGNSIFLPAAGYNLGSSLYSAGSYGYYWSSSLYTGNPGYAYCWLFHSSLVVCDYNYRYRGHSVRPVCQ